MDISDVDPEIVNAVLAHADDYLEAQRRIEEILEKADAELNFAVENAKDGASYDATVKHIDAEVHIALAELIKEYEQRYPAVKAVEQ